MTSAYKAKLEEYIDSEVTIHRAGAPDLTGNVKEVDDDGFTISCTDEKSSDVTDVFVAFEHIRGVGVYNATASSGKC